MRISFIHSNWCHIWTINRNVWLDVLIGATLDRARFRSLRDSGVWGWYFLCHDGEFLNGNHHSHAREFFSMGNWHAVFLYLRSWCQKFIHGEGAIFLKRPHHFVKGRQHNSRRRLRRQCWKSQCEERSLLHGHHLSHHVAHPQCNTPTWGERPQDLWRPSLLYTNSNQGLVCRMPISTLGSPMRSVEALAMGHKLDDLTLMP